MQRFLSYENTILAVVMMVSFINPFTSSALTTALPSRRPCLALVRPTEQRMPSSVGSLSYS